MENASQIAEYFIIPDNITEEFVEIYINEALAIKCPKSSGSRIFQIHDMTWVLAGEHNYGFLITDPIVLEVGLDIGANVPMKFCSRSSVVLLELGEFPKVSE